MTEKIKDTEDRLLNDMQKFIAKTEKLTAAATLLSYQTDVLDSRYKRMREAKEILPYYTQLLQRLTNANVFVRHDILKSEMQEMKDRLKETNQSIMETNERIDNVNKYIYESEHQPSLVKNIRNKIRSMRGKIQKR